MDIGHAGIAIAVDGVVSAATFELVESACDVEGDSAAGVGALGAEVPGIERVAVAIQNAGGRDAVQLRIAEQWNTEFGYWPG